MARETGPQCRLCRRENLKLFLKGERCYTEKCAVERRPYPPGQAGQGRHKFSEYGITIGAGELVMPGALTAAAGVKAGDTVKATYAHIGTVSVRFV